MKDRKISRSLTCLVVLISLACLCEAQPKTPSYQETIQELELKASTAPLGALEYYNLGTAYAKLDSLGPARFNLERAHLMKPWNKNINSNIQWVKTELAADVAILPEFVGSRIWRNIALTASPLFWQILGILLLLAALLFSGWRLYKENRAFKTRHWMLLAGAFLLSLICFGFSSNSSGQIYGGKRCVVITAGEGLKAAPEISAQQLSPLYPGTVVSPLEAVGDWWQVRSEDGSIGWLQKKYVRNISFEQTNS